MLPNRHGACYGFEIESEIPLSFLRTSEAAGTPLTVRYDPQPPGDGTLIHEWNLGRSGKLTSRLFETEPGCYLVQVGDNDSYGVRTQPAGIVVHASAMSNIEQESTMWGTPMAVSMVHKGRLPFHAGSVDVDGRGLVLAATGAYGKTTLAGAFHAAGYRLLADDLSCAIADPEPALLPGPAVVRARPDVAGDYPFKRTSPVWLTPVRTHFALDPDTRGTGAPVPLRAIVFLRISEGEVTLEPTPVADTVRDLFGLSFRLPNDQSQAETFALAAALAARVPAWNLHRPLTLSSLPKVIETIVETCLG